MWSCQTSKQGYSLSSVVQCQDIYWWAACLLKKRRTLISIVAGPATATIDINRTVRSSDMVPWAEVREFASLSWSAWPVWAVERWKTKMRQCVVQCDIMSSIIKSLGWASKLHRPVGSRESQENTWTQNQSTQLRYIFYYFHGYALSNLTFKGGGTSGLMIYFIRCARRTSSFEVWVRQELVAILSHHKMDYDEDKALKITAICRTLGQLPKKIHDSLVWISKVRAGRDSSVTTPSSRIRAPSVGRMPEVESLWFRLMCFFWTGLVFCKWL